MAHKLPLLALYLFTFALTVSSGGFSDSCYNIGYDENTDKLTAVCKRKNNKKDMESFVVLNECLGNLHGDLGVPSPTSTYFKKVKLTIV